MKYKFITIPFDEKKETFNAEALESLEKQYQIKSCKTAFFQSNGKTYWTAFIEYEGATITTIQQEPLSQEAIKKYEGLRGWRNERAEKEGIPPYIIATNKQLQQFAQIADFTLAALLGVKGFGQAKAEKYGKDILNNLNQTKTKNET